MARYSYHGAEKKTRTGLGTSLDRTNSEYISSVSIIFPPDFATYNGRGADGLETLRFLGNINDLVFVNACTDDIAIVPTSRSN